MRVESASENEASGSGATGHQVQKRECTETARLLGNRKLTTTENLTPVETNWKKGSGALRIQDL